ncbi:prolipoprotein diacylglyceryl transferase family protein [Marinicrinis lubricantis]|uniref:Prolipoprotein diacylglyceryl transferase family protein n=1 Tax=Marinicrinis lubricantis TaxID=2086470 RepID=A0ABW1IRE8_9BACL
MPDILTIGPISLQAKLLMIFAAAVAAYYTMKLRMKHSSVTIHVSLLDAFMTGAWICVLFWKFGPVLRQPQWIWEEPLMIILASGGDTYLWIGMAAAIIYFYIWSLRKRVSLWLAADVLAYGLLVFHTVYQVFFWQYGMEADVPWGIRVIEEGVKYHPLNVYLAVLAVLSGIYLWRTRSPLGSGKHAGRFVLAFGTSRMVISLFEVQKGDQYLGFSQLQWWYFACMLLGYVWSYTSIISEKGDEHS